MSKPQDDPEDVSLEPKDAGPLASHHKANFDTIIKAAGNGDLAVMSLVRVSDGKSVAVLTIMQHEQDGGISIIPVATLCEDNPYTMFHPPSKEMKESPLGISVIGSKLKDLE